MKYKVRPYICPRCGNEEEHGTNHEGNIYTNCKSCFHGTLYCNTEEAIKLRESRETITLAIKYYRFSIEYADQKQEYKELIESLKSVGFECFDVIAPAPYQGRPLDPLKELESVDVFNDANQFESGNQFMSKQGRIFLWYEHIYPNRKIKEGYYLIPDKRLLEWIK